MNEQMEKMAEELMLMRDYDLLTRQELEESGELFQGYSERMEMVHQQNALRLESLMEEYGWPDAQKVGPEANEAALLIVLHAISLPDFQRSTLALIKASAEAGAEEKSHYAYLYDRICFYERKPQLFGTQFDWDAEGLMSPWTLLLPDRVDQLRAEMGLPPLEEQQNEIRERVKESGETAQGSFEQRQEEILQWCKAKGWIQ